MQLDGDLANLRSGRDRLTSRGAMKATLKQKNLCRATRIETFVLKQANPTGLVPVDSGLCTTFTLNRVSKGSRAETRDPPGQARWGRLFEG